MPSLGRAWALAAALALAALPACGSGTDGAAPRRDAEAVTVGSFSFSESRTLAEIYAQILEAHGVRVDRALDLASREVAEPALEQAAVDLLPEYLGTALAFLLPEGSFLPGRDEAYERLRRAFAERGVTVLAPAAAENKNGFVVTRATADRLGLRTISDLAPVARQLVLGGPPECPSRRFCLEGLRETYGLEFRRFQPLDVSGPATVAALEGGEVDVAMLFTSDGNLGRGDFVLLEDDRALQPPENIVPVVRTDVLARHPDLAGVVDRATAELRPEDLVALNRRVDLDRLSPADAAREWLRAHGLV
jgi:osmoprotectant transport system substrate-binding protein